MSDVQLHVVDVVVGAATKRSSVKQRIERRLEILREWLRDGVPTGKFVPKGLNAARMWEDPEIGVEAIASPNEFTTTHPVHGPLISDVAGLLTALQKRYKRPVDASKTPSVKPSKFDRKAFDRQLEAAVSQWHVERDQRLQEKKRADAAEARSIVLLAENAQKDELIADLRRQLTSRNGLRVVE